MILNMIDLTPVNFMATYKLGDWVDFGITAAYATGMPYTPYNLDTRRNVNGIWYCDEDNKNSARYPDYLRIDVRAEKRWVFESWNFRMFFEIWNITNHKNIFQYSYRNGYAEKVGETLFPMMPIIGIAAEI